MRTYLKRHSTTLTTALFVISAISGLFLFFEVEKGLFKAMHEWLSVALLAVVVLHIWKNWLPMSLYFKRKPIWFALIASVIVAGLLALPELMGVETGRFPMRGAIAALEGSTITEVAPVFDITPEALIEHLQNNGYVVESTDQTLVEIATDAGQTGRQIVYMTAKVY